MLLFLLHLRDRAKLKDDEDQRRGIGIGTQARGVDFRESLLRLLTRAKGRSKICETEKKGRPEGLNRTRETMLKDLILQEIGTLSQIDEGTWRMRLTVPIDSIGELGSSQNENWLACEESNYDLRTAKGDPRE